MLGLRTRELKIGQSLTELMKAKGLTLKEIANSTGVPISTLSEWKKNHRNPNAVQVAKVADFLGCSVCFLLFREEDSNEPMQRIFREEFFKGAFEITLKRLKLPEE